MKKYTKQWLSLLLAIISLVTFAMPTVFAAGDATPSGQPADLQVDFTADFAAVGAEKDKYAHNTETIWKGIRDGYPSTYKWKFLEDASGKLVNTAYPVRVFGNSKLFQMRPNSANAWGYTPMVITAPGTGNYTFSVNFRNSASAADAQKFVVYLYEVPAEGITKSNIASVTTAHTPVLEVDYEGKNGKVEGTVATALTEGKEYVLVFAIYSDVASESVEIGGFSLNYVDSEIPETSTATTAPTVETTQPTVATTEPTVETTDPTTETTVPTTPSVDVQVDFSADFTAVGAQQDTYVHNTETIWKGIRDGYPDTYKWKLLEDASGKLVNTAYPVRVFGGSKLFQMRPDKVDVWVTHLW